LYTLGVPPPQYGETPAGYFDRFPGVGGGNPVSLEDQAHNGIGHEFLHCRCGAGFMMFIILVHETPLYFLGCVWAVAKGADRTLAVAGDRFVAQRC